MPGMLYAFLKMLLLGLAHAHLKPHYKRIWRICIHNRCVSLLQLGWTLWSRVSPSDLQAYLLVFHYGGRKTEKEKQWKRWISQLMLMVQSLVEPSMATSHYPALCSEGRKNFLQRDRPKWRAFKPRKEKVFAAFADVGKIQIWVKDVLASWVAIGLSHLQH